MSSSRARIFVAVVALVLAGVAALVVLLVRGEDEQSESQPPTEPVLPLLGVNGEVPRQPALAVKIDNTEPARPPTGLTRADVVFEEMVEGGLTRLLAAYHSQDPDEVGPVRSARSTDLFILAELGRPLFAWSGANPTFAAAVEAADLVDVGVSAVPDAYRRASERSAPYNLYASPAGLRDAAGNREAASTPPSPLFSYRRPGAPLVAPDAEPAVGFRTTGSGDLSTEIDWEWDGSSGSWLRSQDGTPHVDLDGERVRAANVIVRFTPYRDSGVRDSTGAVVPEAEAVGEGEAWLLSDGQAQAGSWRKPSSAAPTTYTDADGTPFQLTPGPTWVEILPPESGTVRGQSE